MNQISLLSLYVINQVRLRRLVLNISSRNLSETLEHSPGYVGMVESIANKGQYPPHEWPKLAEALNCKAHDLLPPDEMDQTSTGEFVDKKVLSLDDEGDMKLVVNALIDHGFFNQPKTPEVTAGHLYVDEKAQKLLLELVLNQFVRDSKLSKDGKQYQAT